MFDFLSSIFRSKSKDHIITKYTKDLAAITARIHYLESKLKRNHELLDIWKHRINIYALSILVLVVSSVYFSYQNSIKAFLTLLIGIFIIVGFRCLLIKTVKYRGERLSEKLSKALASHQDKLEELKRETNFYSTSSIIQRFTSGETKSNDALTLMDEELGSKYNELNNLKQELAQLKHDSFGKSSSVAKEETDKWFDKLINILSGGDIVEDSRMQLIVCKACKKNAGCYAFVNILWKYTCPHCGTYQEPQQTSVNTSSTDSSKIESKPEARMESPSHDNERKLQE